MTSDEIEALVLPEDFDEYAWEVEAKGVFCDAHLKYQGNEYPMTFYEIERLAQDVAEALRDGMPFFEQNLVVVRKVTKDEMIWATRRLVAAGWISKMAHE